MTQTNNTPDESEATADSLMDAACKATGLSDWGDESIREPLHVLLESYRKDANLNSQGWLEVHQILIMHLGNRLRIQDELKRNSEILKQEIRKPLFIISLPRTGTTILHRLLAQDPSSRPLRYWEALSPAPPPELQTYDTDPRITAAENYLKGFYEAAPEFAAVHMVTARGEEECLFLLANTFKFPSFKLFGRLVQYFEWLDKQDMVSAYRYHRKQLQLLQLHIPTERWVLKTPWHTYALEALLAVFPDACIIQTHRDPLKVIPSYCSLIATFRGPHSDHLDLGVIGRECLHEWETLLNRTMKVRDTVDSARFLDVHYKDIVQDTVGSVRGIYEYFGYAYNDSFGEKMREYLVSNPKDKHGSHHYTLEQFGLNKEMVNQSFAAYCERFGITPE
ncbi:MAG: sulfotransferase [Desulfobacteraceae bacterium]|nr:sulfotransferase [Desulfobacteraceae bacterium]